ncbi:hypothetical protein NL676_023626 [Syzygium grande]|nr:hypothetical protein NL676_023626 [Syzygium grande]
MRRWFDIVQTNSNEELEKDIDCNVCVFKVPKSISSAKPEAYTPQLVGLGPNHHLRPQLMEMERVKLDGVKKLPKESHCSSFTELTTRLSKLIMTFDALFFFDLLCRHCIGNQTLKLSPYLGALADHLGKKLAKDAILRDVMMLENQIPIFFMEKMLTVGSAPLQVVERKTIAEDNFPPMLFGFYCYISAGRP